MPFLEFEDIDKSFGNNNVISKFNLKVEKGEFVVLLGPSGCGKSTLLRMIAGLEKIDKGKITLESTLINDLLPSKRKIAMVFQSYALYPHMNVFQNISFGLTTEKISKEEIKDELKYNTALKKIEMIIEELNSSNNKFYEALELIEYDENKFLKLKINSCTIKLINIDKNFTSIMRKDIKEKFNSLEFFMNIENKEIEEISEIDLRWNNEGYIIWEDKF